MKIAVLPTSTPLPAGSFDARISLHEKADARSSGSVGTGIISRFNKTTKREAPPLAWDLVSLALGVTAADRLCNRAHTSADGWTRELKLTIAVSNPSLWNGLRPHIDRMLGFLSGDQWSVDFVAGAIPVTPPRKLSPPRPETCVSLLSGGLDSLIGAIDLRAQGETPFFVSNRVKGDCPRQAEFAAALGGSEHLLALNHNAKTNLPNPEISQRPRSLAFIAFGVLAASTLDIYQSGDAVNLYVPENGFIGLNVPLTRMRMGSLSTRTTHPVFMADMQKLLEGLGLPINLINPYRHMTKGEMMVRCADQTLMTQFAPKSMSCGRPGRTYRHCGRCLPCLVRRSAFFHWSGNLIGDLTTRDYLNPDVLEGYRRSDFRGTDDAMQCLEAIDTVKRFGARRWIGSSITPASTPDVGNYRDVALRGLTEIESFFRAVGVM